MANNRLKVLLDTDILSELMRGKNANVAAHAASYRQQNGALTIAAVTVTEIVRGWHKAGRPERITAFKWWLSSAKVLPLEREPAWLAGEIAGELARTGHDIGLADVCIAAIAIHYQRAVVTGNTAHFERIRAAGFKLKLLNWRAPLP